MNFGFLKAFFDLNINYNAQLHIFFDKYTLGLKGWKTRDSYSNEVNFLINDLKINNQIVKDFFKIPKEEDL